MTNFRELARQDRLAVAIYYAWSGRPGSENQERFGIYRCGALTQAGKMAITP